MGIVMEQGFNIIKKFNVKSVSGYNCFWFLFSFQSLQFKFKIRKLKQSITHLNNCDSTAHFRQVFLDM